MLTGIRVGKYLSKPVFIKFSVPPIAIVDTVTPINNPSCCFHGVDPTKYPVFKSCEVAPAIAAAMQTTPPIVKANTA